MKAFLILALRLVLPVGNPILFPLPLPLPLPLLGELGGPNGLLLAGGILSELTLGRPLIELILPLIMLTLPLTPTPPPLSLGPTILIPSFILTVSHNPSNPSAPHRARNPA